MNTSPQAYQNAGQNGSFSYTSTSIGNQTSTFLVLILALIMLVAFLQSEKRYRQLLERLSKGENHG